MKELLDGLGSGWLGQFTRANANVFPICEALHFVGLSILIGAVVVMDLRALGLIRRGSYSATAKLAPVAAAGLILNVLTGIVMISNKPEMYYTNPGFLWKMGFVAFATLNAGWFVLVEHRRLAGLDQGERVPPSIVATAALSLFAWFIVILLGRLLPVTATVPGG